MGRRIIFSMGDKPGHQICLFYKVSLAENANIPLNGSFWGTEKLEDNWFYAVVMDEKVVGYAIAYVQRHLDTTKNMICLYEIGTMKCCRNKGIAKRMIGKIIEDERSADVMKIWIPTNTSNAAASALYRSIGAKEPEVKDEIIYNYRY